MLVKKILVLVFEMLVGIMVLAPLIVALVLGGRKRPPFIPLLLDFSALANLSTVL